MNTYRNRRDQMIQLLTKNPSGMSKSSLAEATKLRTNEVMRVAKLVRGIYIDRWTAVRAPRSRRYQWEPVLCIIEVPEHAPIPERRPTEDDVEEIRESER